jgi:predicted permease
MFLAQAVSAFRRHRMEAEMDEEIRSHLEMAAADSVRHGMEPEQARRLALRSFGGAERTKENCRDLFRFKRLEGLFQDVRLGLRTLRRRPAFTAIAVAMLALGAGINIAVFTVVNAALFKGWPIVCRNDRIVQIATSRNFVYYPDFEAWRLQAKSFSGMALLRGRFHTLDDAANAPETCFTTEVTAGMFPLLGVKPTLGRDFLPSDEQPGAAPVVILRYEVWARRFGADPALVGKAIRIDGHPTTVIGVMPKGFSFPYPMRQDLWTPLTPTVAALTRETGYAPYAFARLADGATIQGARTEMTTIGRRLGNAFPRTNRDVVPEVRSFGEWFIGPDARTLYKSMWAAVGFLLLIVCANVANLLVQQAMSRAQEISIRLALGAGRWRIIRQFLIESLLLSLLSGAIAWWIAKAGVRIYALAQVHEDVLSFAMDLRVFAWLAAISVSTGLAAGLAAAVYLTKQNIHGASIHGAAKDSGRGIAGARRGKRFSDFFVTAEVVLAVALLASAGVLSRSFLKFYTADLGADTANILAISSPDLPPERYSGPAAWISFYRDLELRLRVIPGVESVGFGSAPGDDTLRPRYELRDDTSAAEIRPAAGEIVAGADYFRTLGIRVVSGRAFNSSDRPRSLPVAIVNQRFAARNWPGRMPPGKQIRLLPRMGAPVPGNKPAPWLTIVGVVSNVVENDHTRQSVDSLVYVPFEQAPAPFMPVLARTGVAPASLIAPIRRQFEAMDPELAVPALMPLRERLDRAWTFERNVTALFLFFAAVALLLAAVGLYAAVSHSVSRRVQEIGIRVAIGATGGDILTLVLRQGVLPVGAGLALGLAGSFATNRVLKSQLVGVSPADPIALAAASALLVLCAALGCIAPARRALRLDPAAAVRHE